MSSEDAAVVDKKARGLTSRLGKNVVALGVVSLCTDAASEMAIPLLPIFLAVTLGGGAVAVGVIEGAADAVSSVLKLVSGRLSDASGRRKPLTVVGYSVSSAMRPLLSLTLFPWQVLVVRVGDRIGKGLRTSPRDALLAASVAEDDRGLAYGFHRGMDHAGAVVGPLLAIGALALFEGNLRYVFAATIVPGAIAVIALLVFVKEDAPTQPVPRKRGLLARPSPGLTKVILPFGVFALGNASDLFLLLKAGASRAPLTTLPLLWMGLHVVKMVTSPLGGWLADRVGPRRVVLAGWAWYAVVYVGLALTTSPLGIAVLFVVYGLFHGLTEGPARALVSKAAPEAERGAAFGWYHLVVGLMALPAGALFGALWEAYSPEVAFVWGAAVAAFAALLLVVTTGERAP